MIQGIPKNKHLLLDYAYVPLVAAAPSLLGFKDESDSSGFCYAVAGTVLTYSLLTDAKWSAAKLIPYKVHAMLDIASGVAAFAVPALFSQQPSRKAQRLFLALGITGLVVGALSLRNALDD